MNPHLISDACVSLGFPAPLKWEDQIRYIRRLLLDGHSINTRQARFIGIGNLHSVVSTLRHQGFPLRVWHTQALDPRTGERPPQPVDHLSLDIEQINQNDNALGEPKA
jgi:hypothetical protein